MKWLIKAGSVVLSAFVFGVIGLVVGAGVGGNNPEIIILGKSGYEHLGALGFVAGAVVGAIVALLMISLKKSK